MIESGELIENQDGTSASATLISTLDAFPDADGTRPPPHPGGAVRGPTQRRPKR